MQQRVINSVYNQVFVKNLVFIFDLKNILFVHCFERDSHVIF